jgi:ATP-dependent helicase/nuclease subunit A
MNQSVHAALLCDGAPVDEGAFQQLALDPRRCVVVQACAGSGKTWLLSARIVRALLAGTQPSEVLAITFTRKAADEMAARVNEWLVRLVQGSDVDTAAVLLELAYDAAQARTLAPQAKLVANRALGHARPMAIDTFHGWFGKLRLLAPLTQSDDTFAVLASMPAVIVDQAFEAFLERVGSDTYLLRDYEAVVRRIGWEAADSALRSAFVHHRAEWISFTETAERPAAYAAAAFAKAHRSFDVIAAAQSLRDQLISITQSIVPQKKYASRADKLAEVLEEPAALTPDRIVRLLDALIDSSGGAFRFTQGKEFILEATQRFGSVENFQTAVDQCVETLQNCVQQQIDEEVIALHEHFFRLGSVLSECYAQEKRRRNTIDFTDLELHAAGMLKDREIGALIEAKLDARVRHILVDEFQDTNPLQWRVLSDWLQGYAGAGPRPSIFIVGDAKQSIYRFRRADARIFSAASDMLRAEFGAAVLTTQRTRRNSVAVNELVNAVFADAPAPFGQQVTLSEDQGAVSLLALAGKNDAPAIMPAQTMRDPLHEPRHEQEDDRAKTEARQIAHALLLLAAQSGPAWRWGNVMVLVNRWASAPAVEEAFRHAGILFETGRNGGLLEAPEVQDILALLKVLAQPQDALALAQVLKSPLFSWTDAQLLALLPLARPSGWWAALAQTQQPHAQQAFQTLRQWQDLAAHLPVHDALDAIYAQADVIAKFVAIVPAERAHQAAANLERLLELALDSEGGRYPSLLRFVDELHQFGKLGDNDAPGQGASSADDRVLITTVHGAKGLEREVVVLADAHQARSNPKPHTLIDWPPAAARPAHFSYVFLQDLRTSVQKRVLDSAVPLEALDAQARLYVAMTRARKVLIVSGQDKRGTSEQSWYARVARHVQPMQLADHASADHTSESARTKSFVSDFESSDQPASQPLEVTLAAQQDSEDQRLGKCWHAWLERLARHPHADISRAELADYARRFHLSTEQVRLMLRKAQDVRAHPACAAFFASTQAFSEASVVSADGDVLRIDRVAILGDTLWIGDYKLAVAPPQLPGYAAQLQRYRQLMQALAPDKPVRAVLITGQAQLFELNAQGSGFDAIAGIH